MDYVKEVVESCAINVQICRMYVFMYPDFFQVFKDVLRLVQKNMFSSDSGLYVVVLKKLTIRFKRKQEIL